MAAGMVQMVALQPTPIFADHNAEMGEIMAEAGKLRAEGAGRG